MVLRAFLGQAGAPDHYYTVVVVDDAEDRVVATATLLAERKFVHGGRLCGHVEEVVVHRDYQGRK